MKTVLSLIVFTFISQISFCLAYTISPYVSSYSFMDPADDLLIGSVGGGIRAIICPSEVGFYTGADLFWGTSYPDVDDDLITGDVYLSLKVPIGKRWPGFSRSMGFYIGGGPELQYFIEYDHFINFYFSIFGELGWQTNKKDGIGLHLGLQYSICPYKWPDEDWLILPPLPAFSQILQLGLSWRRISDR